QSITRAIVLNKVLKQNIVERVDFGSTYYSSNWRYITVDAGLAALEIVDGKVHSKMVSGVAKTVTGVDYNNRAVLIRDGAIGVTGLVPGETYRMKFDLEIDTGKASLSNLKADIACGVQLWSLVSGGKTLYDAGTLQDHILSQNADGDRVTYTIGLDFTVTAEGWGSGTVFNAMLSVYTDNEYNIEYWLDNVYIIKKTRAIVEHPRDVSISSTAYGYEGDEIGTAYSDNGLAKFVNVNDTVYGWKETPVTAKSFDAIYRGDVNGDFAISVSDLTSLKRLLFGIDGTYDDFGANANADSAFDKDIDICDLISLKKKLTNTLLAPSYLKYENYALVWNAEFDGNRIPDEFDSQWSSDRKDDVTYVGAGDKKTTKVENGILTYGSVYENGTIITPDHITTKTTMNFTYGYFEVRAKLPFITANLPAFWFKSDGALYKTGTGVHEIDLLETLGSTTSIYTNIHYWNGSVHYSCNAVGGRSFNVSSLDVNEFHNYGMEWYRENGVSYISFYVDGNYIITIDSSMLNGATPDLCNPLYFLLDNGAVSASIHKSFTNTTIATAADFPQNIEVDYVRLYQSRSNEGSVLVVK
ncbi:MAG: family 16 glycosylhydrolase, partial [Clostridia bacterium]|nr:family 16 glycosylhydrolase [Clostridia bacterium]